MSEKTGQETAVEPQSMNGLIQACERYDEVQQRLRLAQAEHRESIIDALASLLSDLRKVINRYPDRFPYCSKVILSMRDREETSVLRSRPITIFGCRDTGRFPIILTGENTERFQPEVCYEPNCFFLSKSDWHIGCNIGTSSDQVTFDLGSLYSQDDGSIFAQYAEYFTQNRLTTLLNAVHQFVIDCQTSLTQDCERIEEQIRTLLAGATQSETNGE